MSKQLEVSLGPKCIEVNASASVGGKVQIVKYDVSSDYHFTIGSRYSLPEGTTEQEAETFRLELASKLRDELEPLAQGEIDGLLAQKAELAR